nr:cytochrome c oxidase subunit III [Bangiopsis subsimplex]
MLLRVLSHSSHARHGFHLVLLSPWPIVAALAALNVALGAAASMHAHAHGAPAVCAGFMLLALVLFTWWRDVLREALLEGAHTSLVLQGLKTGMLLFIASEVALFAAFFWAYLSFALMPAVNLGCSWPPSGVLSIAAAGIPALNTVLLLSSGAMLTVAHHALVLGARAHAAQWLAATVLFGALFSALQCYEYVAAGFDIASSAYGGAFYCSTGLHGLHVLVGAVFLLMALRRLLANELTMQRHLHLECAAWYWHFVDVVWIALFLLVYGWGAA